MNASRCLRAFEFRHNSPAASGDRPGGDGIEFRATVGEITFECALWLGMSHWRSTKPIARWSRGGRGGQISFEHRPALGAWNDDIKPGEGASSPAWRRSEKPQPACRVTTVKLGRYRTPFDAEAEADWITAAVDLSQVDVFLSGAKGFLKLEPMYAASRRRCRSAPAKR